MNGDRPRQAFLHPSDRRKRQRKLYASRRWERVRAFVLERDGGVCQIRLDKCRIRANVVDHITRPEEGGAEFDPANLRAACRSCNMRRHDAAYFREKADAAAGNEPPPTGLAVRAATWTHPYTHGKPDPPAEVETAWTPPPEPLHGRPATGEPFLKWAMSLHGVDAEPTGHRHARWDVAVMVTVAGRSYRVCPESCPSPVRWPMPPAEPMVG